MLPLLDVHSEWCFASANVSLLSMVPLCDCAHLCTAQLVSYRSIFLHEMGGMSWLTLWRCWLHSCQMFILIVGYGLVHRGDCINCETRYFCFDLAFVWPSLLSLKALSAVALLYTCWVTRLEPVSLWLTSSRSRYGPKCHLCHCPSRCVRKWICCGSAVDLTLPV